MWHSVVRGLRPRHSGPGRESPARPRRRAVAPDAFRQPGPVGVQNTSPAGRMRAQGLRVERGWGHGRHLRAGEEGEPRSARLMSARSEEDVWGRGRHQVWRATTPFYTGGARTATLLWRTPGGWRPYRPAALPARRSFRRDDRGDTQLAFALQAPTI